MLSAGLASPFSGIRESFQSQFYFMYAPEVEFACSVCLADNGNLWLGKLFLAIRKVWGWAVGASNAFVCTRSCVCTETDVCTADEGV